jgi:hypothetical protein
MVRLMQADGDRVWMIEGEETVGPDGDRGLKFEVEDVEINE